MDEFGITETDVLKHRLEDHQRWRRDMQQAEQELQHWRTAAENFGHTDAHSWSLSTDELMERMQQAEQERDAGWRRAEAAESDWQHCEKQVAALTQALKDLRDDANRLCDRQLGGTYEEDCRRSIAKADAALTGAQA
jgi:chromosome segregation ATPase